MPVSTHKIERTRGDTTPFLVNVQEEDGTPVDITAYSFVLTVDPSPAPSDALGNLFDLSTSGGEVVITDAANGEITITLDGAQADTKPGDYFYDLQMTDGGGAISTILKGDWEVIQDISK